MDLTTWTKLCYTQQQLFLRRNKQVICNLSQNTNINQLLAFDQDKMTICDILSCAMRNLIFALAKIKAQISCAVTAQLISAFVFDVDSTFHLLPKYEISSLWLLALQTGGCLLLHESSAGAFCVTFIQQ